MSHDRETEPLIISHLSPQGHDLAWPCLQKVTELVVKLCEGGHGSHKAQYVAHYKTASIKTASINDK